MSFKSIKTTQKIRFKDGRIRYFLYTKIIWCVD